MPSMTFRRATLNDCAMLAVFNHQLIQDEGHRNPMAVAELEQRMRGWLTEEYTGVIFEDPGGPVAYALFREDPESVYLRHFFVVRHRRREGIGRLAMEALRSQIWPSNKRLTVTVLTANAPAVAFWRATGYQDYCLTLEIRPT